MPRRWMATGALTVAGVVLLLALIACGGEEAQPEAATDTGGPAATTETDLTGEAEATVVVIEAGEPVGGPARIEVKQGDIVRFRVEADEEQGIHVHGYEVEKTAGPGSAATFSFTAEFEGVFDVETHSTDAVIAKIVVEP